MGFFWEVLEGDDGVWVVMVDGLVRVKVEKWRVERIWEDLGGLGGLEGRRGGEGGGW